MKRTKIALLLLCATLTACGKAPAKTSSAPAAEAATPTATPEPTKKVTTGEANALKSAKSYLDVLAFSYKGLIKQLQYEGYTESEAEYAAKNCGADWKEQAAKCAQNYLDTMPMSKEELKTQLIEYEYFNKEQAEYALTAVGY